LAVIKSRPDGRRSRHFIAPPAHFSRREKPRFSVSEFKELRHAKAVNTNKIYELTHPHTHTLFLLPLYLSLVIRYSIVHLFDCSEVAALRPPNLAYQPSFPLPLHGWIISFTAPLGQIILHFMHPEHL
jgi:hypothetical protein